MHTNYQKNLGLAGLTTMNGSRKAGRNTMLRSPRQRRKAFEKQCLRIIAEVARDTGEGVPVEMSDADIRARIERDPVFKVAHLRICKLREEFFGY